MSLSVSSDNQIIPPKIALEELRVCELSDTVQGFAAKQSWYRNQDLAFHPQSKSFFHMKDEEKCPAAR